MNNSKIYVASSWRNGFQHSVVHLLRQLGHQVYDFKNPNPNQSGFSWSDIDTNWQNWTNLEYVKVLEHPIAKKAFMYDFNAMQWADTCVMVLPCDRSANTEARWMKVMNKAVYVYQPIPQEPKLMYSIYDQIFINSETFVDHFKIDSSV